MAALMMTIKTIIYVVEFLFVSNDRAIKIALPPTLILFAVIAIQRHLVRYNFIVHYVMG